SSLRPRLCSPSALRSPSKIYLGLKVFNLLSQALSLKHLSLSKPRLSSIQVLAALKSLKDSRIQNFLQAEDVLQVSRT
ncbi:hypothetical protein B0H16DRAFT_1888730, partial [Mycena metata]